MNLYKTYKKIKSERLIVEALPLSKAKELASINRNPNIEERLNLIFDKLKNSTKTQVSKRGDRIYIPFNQSEQNNFVYDTEIINYLESNGYKVKDYKTGLCLDKYDRELKIGKVLAKLGNQELLQKFNTDKGRESKNNVNSYMVFSKHSYDIGGSSTDRGWTSCMNLFSGGNARYIIEDVKEGSFVVYLISTNDMNIQKPIARILVKPYVNVDDENDVLYSPTQKIYGTAPDNFLTNVNKILENIQKEKVGIFKFIQTLYKDSSADVWDIKKIKIPNNDKESIEQFCTQVFGTGIKWSVNSNLEVDIADSFESKHYPDVAQFGKLVIKFGEVIGDFNLSEINLTSVEGVPKKVGGVFGYHKLDISSLEGGPKKVGTFICSYNHKLKNLKGAPEEVTQHFWCVFNDGLTSLDGAPKKVGGILHFQGCPHISDEELVEYKKSIGKA